MNQNEKKQDPLDAAKALRKIPSKEQWQYIETELSGRNGMVQLLVDGYHLTIFRTLISKNQLGSRIYINEEIKGEWWKSHELGAQHPNLPEETKRFFRPYVRALYRKVDVAKADKELGKRLAKKWGYHKSLVFYSPEWPSASALRRHLLKHNNNIELLQEGHNEYRKYSN